MQGDLTDAKDRHPSSLVNRFLNEVSQLSLIAHVVILKGNHDFSSEDNPFFGFTKHLPNVTFYSTPQRHDDTTLILPFSRNWQQDWKDLDLTGINMILTHATFDGCIVENGQRLQGGIPPSFFKGFKGKVYSGDIHVPQIVSKNPHIEYVGAPYRVHFGDTYKPRVVLLRKDKAIDLHFPAKGRELLDVESFHQIDDADFLMGTQVKIRVRLKRSEYPDWPEMKQVIKHYAEERGWELYGPELVPIGSQSKTTSPMLDESTTVPEDRVREYGTRKELSKEMVDYGLEFLKEARK